MYIWFKVVYCQRGIFLFLSSLCAASCAIFWLQDSGWVDLLQEILVPVQITTVVHVSFQKVIISGYALKTMANALEISLGV